MSPSLAHDGNGRASSASTTSAVRATAAARNLRPFSALASSAMLALGAPIGRLFTADAAVIALAA